MLTKFTSKYWSALFVLKNAMKCYILRTHRFLKRRKSTLYKFVLFPDSQKVIGSIPIFYIVIINIL